MQPHNLKCFEQALNVIGKLLTEHELQRLMNDGYEKPDLSEETHTNSDKNAVSESESGDKERSDGATASYYELPENAKELQNLISHRNMNSQIGEIFRACYRYGLVSHSDMLRDAKKIKFYAQAEVERLEKLTPASE